MLAVKGEPRPPQTPAETELLEKTLDAALKQLCKKNKVFKSKYMYYLDNKLPLEVCVSGYKSSQVKVFKQLRIRLKAEGFTIGADDKDVFYYTASLPQSAENKNVENKDADGKAAQTLSITLAFDKTVPMPEPEPANDAAAEATPDGAEAEVSGQTV